MGKASNFPNYRVKRSTHLSYWHYKRSLLLLLSATTILVRRQLMQHGAVHIRKAVSQLLEASINWGGHVRWPTCKQFVLQFWLTFGWNSTEFPSQFCDCFRPETQLPQVTAVLSLEQKQFLSQNSHVRGSVCPIVYVRRWDNNNVTAFVLNLHLGIRNNSDSFGFKLFGYAPRIVASVVFKLRLLSPQNY